MTKLTDPQLVLLSKAAQREDRAVEPPARPQTKTTAMIESLIGRGFLTEVPAERAMPVWRHDEATQEQQALVITDRGLATIGVTAELEAVVAPDAVKPVKAAKARSKAGATPKTSPISARKTELVLKLLQRKEGASIAVLTEATGWLPHSTRAALTGLRRKAFEIERGKAKDKTTTIYRIVKAPVNQAA